MRSHLVEPSLVLDIEQSRPNLLTFCFHTCTCFVANASTFTTIPSCCAFLVVYTRISCEMFNPITISHYISIMCLSYAAVLVVGDVGMCVPMYQSFLPLRSTLLRPVRSTKKASLSLNWRTWSRTMAGINTFTHTSHNHSFFTHGSSGKTHPN